MKIRFRCYLALAKLLSELSRRGLWPRLGTTGTLSLCLLPLLVAILPARAICSAGAIQIKVPAMADATFTYFSQEAPGDTAGVRRVDIDGSRFIPRASAAKFNHAAIAAARARGQANCECNAYNCGNNYICNSNNSSRLAVSCQPMSGTTSFLSNRSCFTGESAIGADISPPTSSISSALDKRQRRSQWPRAIFMQSKQSRLFLKTS